MIHAPFSRVRKLRVQPVVFGIVKKENPNLSRWNRFIPLRGSFTGRSLQSSR